MNLFQIVLVVVAAAIVIIWAGSLPSKIDKLKYKKGEYLVSDKMLSEDEKQKIRDEDYVNFWSQFIDVEKIHVTANGTVLNSKPHIFKDFINNQKLPSKLALIWEILDDNNLKISDIIKLIESGAPYPMDTKVGMLISSLKVTLQQMRMIEILNMYEELIKIDDKYPLYIEFSTIRNFHDKKITVTYQAGYDDKNPYRGYLTIPEKY